MGTKRFYTSTEAAELTGLAYQTVLAYARRYPDLVPSERRGNRVLFQPEAIAALKQLREETMRRRVDQAEAGEIREQMLALLDSASTTLLSLSRELEKTRRRFQDYRPASSIWIHTLPPGPYRLKRPISVLLQRVAGSFVASFAEADLEASARNWKEAIHRLRVLMLRTLMRLQEEAGINEPAPEQLLVLSELTVPNERWQLPGGM